MIGGVLIFQQTPAQFEAIALARTLKGGPVFPEMQLAFTYDAATAKWSWTASERGPVNPMFHDWFVGKMTPEHKAAVAQRVQELGDLLSKYLGSYLHYVQQPGAYVVHPAKPGKYKIKNGKIKKVYRPATVGYKQYEQVKKETRDARDASK
jgi:predicted RNA binding protein YcfA (HicA-like mRNA interferase family)